MPTRIPTGLTRARRPGPETRTVVVQLGTQFADGFGGRFNSLVLALYALRIGGLEAFSGLLAVGMVGSVLAAVASGMGTSRLGARRTMRVSAAALALARLASYGVIFVSGSVTPILLARFVGGVAAGVIMAGAKSQAPRNELAASRLAWLNVANGGGQALGAMAAGAAIAWASPGLLTASGLTVGLASIVPMYRIARHSVPVAVPFRTQLRGQRAAAPVVAFGAVVYLVAMSLVSLSDALVVKLQSETWLGAATMAAFVGALLAATLLRSRPDLVSRDPLVAWPLLGVLALAGWQVAGMGWPMLLATMTAGGFAGQMLAAMVEHHVIHRVEADHAISALAASAAAGSLASALALVALPRLIGSIGVEASAGLLLVGSLALVVIGPVTRRRVSPATV